MKIFEYPEINSLFATEKKPKQKSSFNFQIYNEWNFDIVQQDWNWNGLDSILKFSILFVIETIKFGKFSTEHLHFSKFPLKKIISVESRFMCLRRRIDVYSPSIGWENVNITNMLSSRPLCIYLKSAYICRFLLWSWIEYIHKNEYWILVTLSSQIFFFFLVAKTKCHIVGYGMSFNPIVRSFSMKVFVSC